MLKESPFRRMIGGGAAVLVFLLAGVFFTYAEAGQGMTDAAQRRSLLFEKKMLPIEAESFPATSSYPDEEEAPRAVPRKTETATHDPVAVTDKPLVLGGRGLAVDHFQHAAEAERLPDFLKRLENPFPYPPPALPAAKLDPHLTDVKSTKHLVFRILRPALGRIPDVDPDRDARVAIERRADLDAIEETHLDYFNQEQTEIQLLPAARQMDILIGNENVNREDFNIGVW